MFGVEGVPSSANLHDRVRHPVWDPAYEGVFLMLPLNGGALANDTAI